MHSTTPRVELSAAPRLRFTGDVDSNSPAVWQRVAGLNQLLVLTSVAGRPSLASGPQLDRLSVALPVVVDPWPGEGVWMEAVIEDVDGTLYGYYHNENSATVCPGSGKVIPRIGAARSDDHGLTWTSLGLVLEAPPGSFDCETNDMYFVGGVGDFSVQLDADSRDLYIFYSQYSRRSQGVGVARLAWADRDDPVGQGHGLRWRCVAPGASLHVPQRDGAVDLPVRDSRSSRPGNPGTTMTLKWTRSGDPPCTGTSTSNST